MPAYDDDFDDSADDPTEGFVEDDAHVDCPHCGAAIFADAEWCPRCENYLSDEDAPPRRSPWVVVIVLVLVGLMLLPYLLYLVSVL